MKWPALSLQPTAPSIFLLCLLINACSSPSMPIDYNSKTNNWPHYGGSQSTDQHSPLTQINRDNIGRLELAWSYQLPAMSSIVTVEQSIEQKDRRYQAQPLVVNDTLYACAITGYIVALNPLTGLEKWRIDVNANSTQPQPLRCRSLGYWQARERIEGTIHCQRRLFFTTPHNQLQAVDADNGQACSGFGNRGSIDLNDGIDARDKVRYQVKSIGIVVKGLIIVGSAIADNISTDAPSGVVRAYDTSSGKLVWAWDASPSSKSNSTRYQNASVNSWGPMSADAELGLVYIPTGNPSPDLFGGQRDGADHYGSSVVALDLNDGSVRWHFQAVHHDVWDYDVAAAPALFQNPAIGQGKKGLALSSKTGNIFLLDRATGEPLYPVEERAVPQLGVIGEQLAATQPFATHPTTIHPQSLDAWGFTPFDRADCQKKINHLRWQGPFTPPSLEGSISFPGASGGINWGGAAIDSQNGILLVNQTIMPWVIKLIPRQQLAQYDAANYPFPSQLFTMQGTPYGALRYPLLSAAGAPCSEPPWGTLTAIDLVSGKQLWQRPLGTTRDQAPWPLWLELGTPNLGGVITTAGGIAFATGSTDHFLRAFDIQSGEEVWRRRSSGTVMAVPMTFRLDRTQKQYVVFAISGDEKKAEPFKLVAYTLATD
ncbi:quinoprotein glucose dehydrogenase/quinate dehydrogenase (quinone) [Sinobacterium caligoides]|uniref:Quinoprotein glucose dehydrogenase/quinate dehydrogenase (Quinone) n=1 Tax=Sinobacterium caligoides TaxID=933926 RepID=A0A3N2DPD6_9GAMM|nr:pyrroloquinoline quinone-dependent dehydrogenase [Sinobacterium caligoides]ROS01185.1 quinoprotein glucose dehydrogenase/quinate dehydrogenase (quinone) [Sinobacterium caligoides]